ncbi:ABC transporter ATP-binding protein [candidate division KSB1 bacterium 4572_119]|nr:MAG: ABC transporter ATP-binding protein [candidate division KSB1 bacterium 4572_119]
MSASLLITTQSISKSYSVQPLFTDISITFFERERLGLIGPNGSGKTTLLKILAEIEPVDSGKILRKRDTRLIYLPQDDIFDETKTIKETLTDVLPKDLEVWEFNKRIQTVKELIKVDNLDKMVNTLSGGWRKRLAIGRAILQKPDMLLIDEPTNHLDLEGILWLESLLKSAPFAFVLVSHDRMFLENITNRMIELNRRYPDGFIRVEGNYSEFLRQRNQFISEQMKHELVLSNKARREIEWLRRGPKARTTKAKYRVEQAYQLKNNLNSVKSRNAENQRVRIDFDATRRRTKKLLEARELKITRDNNLLFEHLNLILSPGMCIGTPDEGTVQLADGVKIETFDQLRNQINPSVSLKQALSPEGDTVIYQGRPVNIKAWAKRFLFQEEQLIQPVSNLSGGEKARLLIAKLMKKPADILLLDEPTNDLDISTLEVLEESLMEFPGAVVLITHDRYLMDRLSDEILLLDGDGIVKFFSDYDQLINYQNDKIVESAPAKKKTKSSKKRIKKLTASEQKELKNMEQTIGQAEENTHSLKQELQNPKIQSDAPRLEELFKQLQEAESRVEYLYARWEELEILNKRD